MTAGSGHGADSDPGEAAARLFQPSPRRLPPSPRILIIRFSSLGDVVKCTALPRLIRRAYPDARVTMVTSSDYLELIAGNPHLARAIGFDRRAGPGALWALARELRAEGFHLAADVHRSLRSRMLRALLRVPRTTYSKRTWQRWLLIQFRRNTYARPRGKEEDFLAGLAPYGVTDDGQGTEIHLPQGEAHAALERKFAPELERLRAWRAAGRPIVGVAPVAAHPLKVWPLERVRAAMGELAREPGAGLLLFGGPGDGAAHALGEGLGEAALSLVGRTTLLESAWFASQADVMIANDTGMTHIAEAVGTPVAALYGPTSRELGYYPVRAASVALEAPLPCRPCTRTGAGRCTHPLPHACMLAIPPERVVAAVRGVLAGGGREGGAKAGRRP